MVWTRSLLLWTPTTILIERMALTATMVLKLIGKDYRIFILFDIQRFFPSLLLIHMSSSKYRWTRWIVIIVCIPRITAFLIMRVKRIDLFDPWNTHSLLWDWDEFLFLHNVSIEDYASKRKLTVSFDEVPMFLQWVLA